MPLPSSDEYRRPQAPLDVPSGLADNIRVALGPGAWNEDCLRSFLDASDRPGSLGKIGPYEVEKIHSEGAMGGVLRGLDPTGRRVAIKVPAPRLLHDARAAQRLLREVEALKRLHHPNVVPFRAALSHRETLCLVMDFVCGVSLGDLVPCERPAPAEVRRIGAQVAAGLAAIHHEGIVHRDLKPDNVLLQVGGGVKIVDFGLAQVADAVRLTQSGTLVGTPAYMAPEQARGARVDHRADLFSLGSVLYFLCSGREPFAGNSLFEVLGKVCQDEPPPLGPDVPDSLKALVRRLLAKAPDERIQSAEEVTEMLIDPTVRGRIVRPVRGEQLRGRIIPVVLDLSSVPAGSHVWLAVERGGRFWPKEVEHNVIHEGGPVRDKFTLSLWLVSAQGHEEIRNWFGWAGRYGWPPLAAMPGGTRLDSIEDLQIVEQFREKTSCAPTIRAQP